MKYIQNKDNSGSCRMNSKGCCKVHEAPLNIYDWLCDVPESTEDTDFVEVQFKNTRKEFYLNSEKLDLKKGDIVVVEAQSAGHDIGTVVLTGRLVLLSMKKHRYKGGEPKQVYRIAKDYDIERWHYAQSREHETMIEARQITQRMDLDMKIGDVEYQGDGNKAIFYYIADGRVDFRQLIRVLADTFRVRIEMKQIGSRQEAGRIGGTGSCGRQLCCSAWMSNFVSVGTSAARYQDLSLNPQKLTGQCSKLKCCINFEVDTYVEATKTLPSRELKLETANAVYYHFKTDVFNRQITYSTARNAPVGLVTISADRVYEVVAMNKRNEKPDTLEYNSLKDKPSKRSADILSDNVLNRFDGEKRTRSRGKNAANERGRDTNGEKRNERSRSAARRGGARRGTPESPASRSNPPQQGARPSTNARREEDSRNTRREEESREGTENRARRDNRSRRGRRPNTEGRTASSRNEGSRSGVEKENKSDSRYTPRQD